MPSRLGAGIGAGVTATAEAFGLVEIGVAGLAEAETDGAAGERGVEVAEAGCACGAGVGGTGADFSEG